MVKVYTFQEVSVNTFYWDLCGKDWTKQRSYWKISTEVLIEVFSVVSYEDPYGDHYRDFFGDLYLKLSGDLLWGLLQTFNELSVDISLETLMETSIDFRANLCEDFWANLYAVLVSGFKTAKTSMDTKWTTNG